MSTWDEIGDDELMAELAAAEAEADAVPERRRTAARAAFVWRTVEEELAQLLHDSALEAGAAVRSAGGAPRTLSFIRGGVTLEIELADGALLGELIDGDTVGEPPTTVALQRPDAEDRVVEVDDSGFFRFEEVGSGPARFVVSRAGWSLTTPWATL